MKAQKLLRKNKISFQTSDKFGDWLVDTTEKEIISIMEKYAEIKNKEKPKFNEKKFLSELNKLMPNKFGAQLLIYNLVKQNLI